MIYRILIIILILCTSCDEKDKETSVTITGIVTDAVTGEPVSGAHVGLKIYFCMDGRCYSSVMSSSSFSSASDGSYSVNYKYNTKEPVIFKENSFMFPAGYYTYASKDGYIESDLHHLGDNILHGADIMLYHGAQLNVHVKNDGINKLDGVRVCIDKGYGFSFFGTPQFILYCKGLKLDSVYVLKNLVGGYSYGCHVIPLTGSTYNPLPLVKTSVLMKPDTITDLAVSF